MATKISLIRLSLAVGFTLAASGSLGAQSPAEAHAEREKARQLSFMTMPQAAKAAGQHYVRTMNVGNWVVADSLDSLAKASELVVVGEVTSAQPALSRDQMYISTVSLVRVDEVIKDNASVGVVVKIVTVGG